MPTTCTSCQAVNPDGARFCQGCGATFGATQVQGKTLIHSGIPVGPGGGPAVVRPPIPPAGLLPTLIPGPRPPAHWPTSLRSVREELAFVLDVSGSMSETYDLRWSKLDAAKRAVITLLLERSRISPQDQLALVSFDDHAQVEFPLSTLATDKAQMIQAIQALQIRGGTDINAGLKEAGSLFDFCHNAKRRIILLTDGQGGHPLRTAEGLKSQGVMIECIGIGQSPTCVDEALLRQVATTSNGECHYRFITDQRTLIDHVTRLGAQP